MICYLLPSNADFATLFQIPCIDRSYALILLEENTVPTSESEAFIYFEQLLLTEKYDEDWTSALENFGKIYSSKFAFKSKQSSFPILNNPWSAKFPWFNLIAFRVTGERDKIEWKQDHEFKAMDVAGKLGSGISKKFNWKVNLRGGFDIHILLKIFDGNVIVAMELQPPEYEIDLRNYEKFKSMYDQCPFPYRSIRKEFRVKFARTSLKLSTAYCLLKESQLQNMKDAILVDAMCGCGTIPLVASVYYHENCAMILATDKSEECVQDSQFNFNLLNKCVNENPNCNMYNVSKCAPIMHAIQADIKFLPFRDASIDALVTEYVNFIIQVIITVFFSKQYAIWNSMFKSSSE